MTKTEFIEKEVKGHEKYLQQHEKVLQEIKDLDDRILKLFDLSLSNSRIHLSIEITSVDEMYKILHEARKIYDFILDRYFIIYKNYICILFKSTSGLEIRFYISGDQDEIINKVSNGKCKVIKEESSCHRILCDI